MADKLIKEMWVPLYDRVACVTGLNILGGFESVEEACIVGDLYNRACQRQYGDSRVDHIHPTVLLSVMR